MVRCDSDAFSLDNYHTWLETLSSFLISIQPPNRKKRVLISTWMLLVLESRL
jgi:hypothetical protein